MEPKGKSENQKANLEMVLESISENLHSNADTAAELLDSNTNLNQTVEEIKQIGEKGEAEQYHLKVLYLSLYDLHMKIKSYTFFYIRL